VRNLQLTGCASGYSFRVHSLPGEAAMVRSLLTLFLALPGFAWAHGGGLDANGCHHDRKKGGYHCHGGGAAPASPQRQGVMNSSGVGAGVEYANCSEARSAGAAPVRRGDPGYSRKLDRDGDGVGCE
jgi:hypothetical protein